VSEPAELPPGWRWASFSEVASIDSELVSPADFPDHLHLAPNHVEKGTGRLLPLRTVSEDGVTSNKNRFYPGQIVYSKIRPYLSKVVIADFEGLCSADMYPISTELNTRFLFWYMLSGTFLGEIERRSGNRVVLPKVNQKQLNSVRVPVPPEGVQGRLAARIDDLQARSDEASEALDAIPPLLERFRQSVLASAFRGDLTREWRAQNPDVEPASELLERSRAERKARFIEDAAEKALAKAEAKAKATGKAWTDDDDAKVVERERAKAEKKYKAPEPVDASELSELPEGWCWASCAELGEWGSGGTPSRRKPGLYGGEIPWVKSGELPDGKVEATEETLTREGLAQSSAKLFPAGSVLVAMYGATIGKVGVLEAPAATNQAVAALLPDGGASVRRDFVFWYLIASRRELRRLGQGGAQPNISQTVLKRFPVPVPPLAEQAELARMVTARLGDLSSLESVIRSVRHRFRPLESSILAAAFRGEIT
jgi:type I restriction enzyme, S subunit